MALPDSMTSMPALTSLCIALVVVASALIPTRSSASPRNDTATVLANQYNASTSTFGQTLEIINPRIARLGLRFTF